MSGDANEAAYINTTKLGWQVLDEAARAILDADEEHLRANAKQMAQALLDQVRVRINEFIPLDVHRGVVEDVVRAFGRAVNFFQDSVVFFVCHQLGDSALGELVGELDPAKVWMVEPCKGDPGDPGVAVTTQRWRSIRNVRIVVVGQDQETVEYVMEWVRREIVDESEGVVTIIATPTPVEKIIEAARRLYQAESN
jgi:hypothetical protein